MSIGGFEKLHHVPENLEGLVRKRAVWCTRKGLKGS